MNRPQVLAPDLDSIPTELQSLDRWVLWRNVLRTGPNGKESWTKVPFTGTGASASSTNQATWCSYTAAVDEYVLGEYDGIGIVLGGTLHGIDLDDCRDPATGVLSDLAQETLDRVEGYAEVSPSGTGIKIFTRTNLDRGRTKKGVELYKDGRYFTVTGHAINGHNALPELPQDLGWLVERVWGEALRVGGSAGEDAFANLKSPLDGWDLGRVVDEVLVHLDPDVGYGEWLKVGAAMHHQGSGDGEWFEAWDSWSAGSGKWVEGYCGSKWDSFSAERATGKGLFTLAGLIWTVGQKNLQQALKNGQLVLVPSNCMQNAGHLIEHKFKGPNDLELYHSSSQWYRYAETHYAVMEDNTVRSEVWKFLDLAKKQTGNGSLVPFVPLTHHVSGVIDALKAKCHLQQCRPPIWINESNVPLAGDVVSLKNGLFHLPSCVLMPHTSSFFTVNALPFAWDPAATAPMWGKFLNEIWPQDTQSIETLQEVFGYLIATDTRMQKIFMLLGPRRSGKGTIGRIIDALIGTSNLAGPTLASLTKQFGLEPLIHKLVALISDARTPGRDHQIIVERLLMISGEDTVSVDRKHKDSWVGRMTARIVLMSNEALRLGDSSGALIGRMIVLQIHETFYGREDTGLTNRLISELSGIFNWALVGRQRLYARGHFVQPQSSVGIVEEMAGMNSPISIFLNQCCDLGAGLNEDKGLVYEAYQQHANKNHQHVLDHSSFSRAMYAANPSITAFRPRDGDSRRQSYGGLRLKEHTDKFL